MAALVHILSATKIWNSSCEACTTMCYVNKVCTWVLPYVFPSMPNSVLFITQKQCVVKSPWASRISERVCVLMLLDKLVKVKENDYMLFC